MKPDGADRLASRLVMAAPAGAALSEGEGRILDEGRVGHLILFRRSFRSREETIALVAGARARAGAPMLVAADQEGGIISVASAVIGSAPSPMHLGARRDEGAVEAWARSQASRLRALGVDMVLAPVLDVQARAGSRVIGTRSFGGGPGLIARLGAAAVRGSLSGGAIPVGKHFPDHGGVRADSHVGLPVDRRSRREMLAAASAPSRAAIAAGLPAVMIAHVAYPGLGTGSRPASLSPEVIEGFLRSRLGFGGVVLSDALEMEGFPGEEAVPAALAAGIDLFCAARSLAQGVRVARRLARSIRGDRRAERRAEESAARVETLLRGRPRKSREAPPPPERPWEGIVRLGRGRWRPPGAGGWRMLVPARLGGRLSLPVGLRVAVAPWGESFLRRRVIPIPFDPDAPARRRALARVPATETLVLGTLTRGDLPEGQRRMLAEAARRPGRRIVVALLDPHPVLDLPEERLFTFDFRPPTLEALFRILLGEKLPEGRLPLASR
ncbi:MAG: glycoside hydrolase family 3 N-terminal domain-containing protein [Candidatus Eisenbacteria bacterium]